MTTITVVRSIGRLATCGTAGTLEDAALAFDEGAILYAGSEDGLAEAAKRGGWSVGEEVDAEGALVTPGLVDAHTHPLYGGSRFAEIASRSAGASYSEIAAGGGGISSTVVATRATPAGDLAAAARSRLESWLAGGATTVEAKTGYHLSREGELEAVRILASLAGAGLPWVEVTWLAGHAVGPEYVGDPDGYVEAAASWCGESRAAGARHADVFCDAGYFTVDQSRRLLSAAAGAGLIPRIHADELARTGGSQLAAELGCASADHLLLVEASDAKALASAGVVATLAPVTALAMGVTPPVRELVDAGVTIALGSDHNPGTCGTTSMTLVIALAVSDLGLSVSQALTAATAGGAASLRLGDRGRLQAGLRPDAVLWDADHEGAFAWSYGLRPRRVWTGAPRA
ncbi:MAG: imidazolonepropionase [Acidimicrobiales bacterium]